MRINRKVPWQVIALWFCALFPIAACQSPEEEIASRLASLRDNETSQAERAATLDWLVENGADWAVIEDAAVNSLSATSPLLADSGLRALQAHSKQAGTKLVEVLSVTPADPTPIREALTLLARDNPDVQDYLLTFVANADGDKAVFCAEILMNLGQGEQVAGAILRSLTIEAASVRQSQAARLAGIIHPGNDAIRERLIALLEAPEWIVRYEAILALRRLGAEDHGLREILDSLQDDPVVRVRQIANETPE